MTTRVDIEDIASTRSEKALAVVLAVFLIIGSSWLYVKIDPWTGADEAARYTSSEQAAVDRLDAAAASAGEAEVIRDDRRADVADARGDLQLAIDRDRPTQQAERSYERAQRRYERSGQDLTAARTDVRAAQSGADRADRALEERTSGGTAASWVALVLRLLLVVALVAGSLRLLARLRARESRFLPLAFSVVATGAVMAVVFAVDYVTDYIDPLDLGPIVLSLAGAALTVAAFIGLQRYLARRLPRARVRRGECPFCGFPVRHGREDEHASHCEGCGREVLASCATCDARRRVGSPHCATCGAT